LVAIPSVVERSNADAIQNEERKKENVFGLHFKNGDAIDAKAFKVWWVIIEIALLTIY
jgi:hypothetical protein